MKTVTEIVTQLFAELKNGELSPETLEKERIQNRKMIALSIVFFRTFPSKIEDFNTFLNDACPFLYLHSPLFISATNLGLLRGLYDTGIPPFLDWKAIHVKTSDPTIDNPYWQHMQATRRYEIEQLLLSVFHDIPESAWTEEARTKLRRPARATTHTAAHIMDIAPDMTIAAKLHLGIKLHFHNPETPDSDEMPKYQHIVLEYFIGDKGLDPATINFGNATEVKHQYFMLNFIEANVGKWVYIRARYVNSKGQPSLFWTAVLPSPIS